MKKLISQIKTPRVNSRLCLLGISVLLVACSRGNANPAVIDTTAAVRNTRWSDKITITLGDGSFRYQSDSIPNHALNEEYVMPDNLTTCVLHPTPACTHIEPVTQAVRPVPIDFTITTKPQKMAKPVTPPFGAVGVMISGSPVYNPYEGDGVTVAMNGNFNLINQQGKPVAFMDDCHGHPAPHPRAQYHYHGLPPCVTAQVDQPNGPSRIIGYAFDGFPIYGDRDIIGKKIDPTKLDECNGIESPTPEFPNGIYHYVLLNVPTAQSTIRCLYGRLDAPLFVYQWK